MYKIGSTGPMVRNIQQALKITVDGIFGKKTQAAVVKFQRDNHLVADGIVGRNTMEALGILETDLMQTLSFKTPNNLVIHKHHLPKDEYIWNADGSPILNDYFMLHHTAGWNNPTRTVDHWARDSRGRVATEFVIGGQNIKNGDDQYDGMVVQAFPEGGQGWHIGPSGSYYMNRHCAAVEVCNFGFLDKEFKNYVGIKAHESQRVTLSEKFKGYINWHKYSDDQLYALKKLCLYVAERDNIDIRVGLIEWIKKEGVAKAFEFHQEAYDGEVKGMILHANVQKGKVDLFPQPELVDMLLSL